MKENKKIPNRRL